MADSNPTAAPSTTIVCQSTLCHNRSIVKHPLSNIAIAANSAALSILVSPLAARTTIGFYGSTPNYAFQFDDLGHVGLRDKLSACLKTGDSAGSEALITDEILDQFAVVARWDEVADQMIARYKGIAARLVIYLASHWREVDPKVLERWGEVARAVRGAGQ